MDKKKRKLTKQDEHHINNVITLTNSIIEQIDGYSKLEIKIVLSMVTSIWAHGVPAREDWPEAIAKLAEWFSIKEHPLSSEERWNRLIDTSRLRYISKGLFRSAPPFIAHFRDKH